MTGVLSEMIITNPRAGAVTMSIPEDEVITITSLRDSNNHPIALPTPLSPASISFSARLIRSSLPAPNVFLAMLAAQSVSQLDGVSQRGMFVYDISLGANVYMHGTAEQCAAVGLPWYLCCVGSPGNVGTAPSGMPNQQTTTCVSITSIRGSLEVN